MEERSSRRSATPPTAISKRKIRKAEPPISIWAKSDLGKGKVEFLQNDKVVSTMDVDLKAGMNRFQWNMRGPAPPATPGVADAAAEAAVRRQPEHNGPGREGGVPFVAGGGRGGGGGGGGFGGRHGRKALCSNPARSWSALRWAAKPECPRSTCSTTSGCGRSNTRAPAEPPADHRERSFSQEAYELSTMYSDPRGDIRASGVFAQPAYDTALKNLKFRSIGPATMGGRLDDIAVVESDPRIIYIGAAGGGLFKTVNGGITWKALFEDQSNPSIGDIAIAPSNPSIVYVGTGEANNRQSSSWGNGVYKTMDGGATWTHLGLAETHHIGRIVVHPNRPEYRLRRRARRSVGTQ